MATVAAGFPTPRRGIAVRATSAVTLATSTSLLPVPLDTVDYNDDGYVFTDAADSVTVPRDGLYEVRARTHVTPSAAVSPTNRTLWYLYVNAAANTAIDTLNVKQMYGNTTGSRTHEATWFVALSASDVLTLRILHDLGVDIDYGHDTLPFKQTTLTVRCLSPD